MWGGYTVVFFPDRASFGRIKNTVYWVIHQFRIRSGKETTTTKNSTGQNNNGTGSVADPDPVGSGDF